MKAYSIFDDFPAEASEMLAKSGIDVTIHPLGKPRPEYNELKELLAEYDAIIISTAQKMPEKIFGGITAPKIIATASIGVDHIQVPEDKKEFIRVVNAPKANRISVAEHTFGLILTLRKQLTEARTAAAKGQTKKTMTGKPRDLYNSTIGVVGAGGTAGAVLKLARAFGMKRIAWTLNPDRHSDLASDGVEFVSLERLMREADVVSVNLPLTDETTGLISAELIGSMKADAVFISASRTEVVDNAAVFKRASENASFCVGMDVDSDKVFGMWDESMNNVIVTPHIAGGTVESRARLFNEVSVAVIDALKYIV